MGVSSTRLSLKIANKYRLLQHLLLTHKKNCCFLQKYVWPRVTLEKALVCYHPCCPEELGKATALEKGL